MIKLQRQNLLAGASLSRMQIVLIIVVFIFLIVNVAMLLLVTLPQRRETTKNELMLKESLAQSFQLADTYTLQKLPQSDVDKLKIRAPFERKDSDVLLDFLEVAAISNVYVTYLNQSGLDNNGAVQVQASGNTGPNGNTEPNPNEISSPGIQTPTGTMIEPVFKLKLIGNREGILSSINHLHQHDRLYQNMKWVITHKSRKQAEEDHPNIKERPMINLDEPIYEIDLDIRTYILGQYAHLFTNKTQ